MIGGIGLLISLGERSQMDRFYDMRLVIEAAGYSKIAEPSGDANGPHAILLALITV
jgi:hypothetical protein